MPLPASPLPLSSALQVRPPQPGGMPGQACPPPAPAGTRTLGRSPLSAVSEEQHFLRAPSGCETCYVVGEPASTHHSPAGSLRTGPRSHARGTASPPQRGGTDATWRCLLCPSHRRLAAGEMARRGPVSWACWGDPGGAWSQQSGALPRTGPSRWLIFSGEMGKNLAVL